MSWIGRALSSVSSYYKEINPATLSGAIDIIVVSRTRTDVDPDTGEQKVVEELACSPWHVRFGKLSVLRPIERKVVIEINGTEVPFQMKITETGEAFFVFETTAPVPSELQTSPLVEPIRDEDLEAARQAEARGEEAGVLEGLEAVPDFDDLGESRASEAVDGGSQPGQGKRPARRPDAAAPSSPETSSAISEASTGLTRPSSRDSAADGQEAGKPSDEERAGETTPREAPNRAQHDEAAPRLSRSSSAASQASASTLLKAPLAAAATLSRAAMSGVTSTATRSQRMDRQRSKKRDTAKEAVKDTAGRLDEKVSGATAKSEEKPGGEGVSKDSGEEAVQGRAEGEGRNAANVDETIGALNPRMKADLGGKQLYERGGEVREAARKDKEQMAAGLKGGSSAGKEDDPTSPTVEASDAAVGIHVATGPHEPDRAESMLSQGPGPSIGPNPLAVSGRPSAPQRAASSSASSSHRPSSRPPVQRSSSHVSTRSKRRLSGRADELMLDMAGYKLSSSDDATAASAGRELLAASAGAGDPDNEGVTAMAQGVKGSGGHDREDGGIGDLNFDNELGQRIAQGITGHHGLPDQEEVMALTKALLRSADRMRPKDIGVAGGEGGDAHGGGRGFKFPTTDSNPGSIPPSTATSPQLRPVLDDLEQRAHEGELVPKDDDDVSPVNAAAVPYQFSLRADGVVHIFELSLCGDESFGRASEALDAKSFYDRRVSFGHFMDQPDVVNHQALVMKYHGRYLTWENASPVLASLAIYRKGLPEGFGKELGPVDGSAVERVAGGRGGDAGTATPGGTAAEGKRPPYRPWTRWWTKTRSETALPLRAASEGPMGESTSPAVTPPASPRSLPARAEEDKIPPLDEELEASPPNKPTDAGPVKQYAKTLRLTSDQLGQLGLKKGLNNVSFSVRSSYSGWAVCTSRIFFWDGDHQVCISDIDGTITKSDALGHVFNMIGRDWTHAGVAKLYTDIARNGYRVLYLTSRAIGQADTTREYLKGINQAGFTLPDGPVIMSPDRLMTSLHREVIMRKPEVFKMACLRDIQRLFHERNPFYAGFGNRITDALSYRSVDVPSSRIFTIDTNGDVKMELLELAGYKSSYIHMTDLVDQMFPPINRKAAPEYTDFNFWRAPLPAVDLPDLAPPSPALSARSGDSRISFPRLSSLSLGRSRSPRPDLEKQSNGVGRRGHSPSSPLVHPVLAEEPDELEDVPALDEEISGGVPMARDRSPSVDSMPGSLPGSMEERSMLALRGKKIPLTEAEEYRLSIERLRRREEGLEDEFEDEEDDDRPPEEADDDDFPQMDFSSVPYL